MLFGQSSVCASCVRVGPLGPHLQVSQGLLISVCVHLSVVASFRLVPLPVKTKLVVKHSVIKYNLQIYRTSDQNDYNLN